MTNHLTGRTIFLFILLCIIGYITYQWYKRKKQTPSSFADTIGAPKVLSGGSNSYSSCNECIKQNPNLDPPYKCIEFDTWCKNKPQAHFDEATGSCTFQKSNGDTGYTQINKYPHGWHCNSTSQTGGYIVSRPPAPQRTCSSTTFPNSKLPIISSFCPLSTTNEISPRNEWKECKIIQRNNESPISVNKYKIKQKAHDEWYFKNLDGSPFADGLRAETKHRFANCQIQKRTLPIFFPMYDIITSEIQWCNIQYFAGRGCPHGIDQTTGVCIHGDTWYQHQTNGDTKYAVWC